MRTSLLSTLILAAVLSGCGAYADSAALRSMVMSQPLEFLVGRDSAEVVWGRARSWFETSGNPRVASIEGSKIVSTQVNLMNGNYTLQVERRPEGDSVSYRVDYIWNPGIRATPEDAESPKYRAHELAYTIRTGETPAQWMKRSR